MLAVVNQRLGQTAEAEELSQIRVAGSAQPDRADRLRRLPVRTKRYADADASFRRTLNNLLFNTPGWPHNAGSCGRDRRRHGRCRKDYRAALRLNRVSRRACWVWPKRVFATRICRHGPTFSVMLGGAAHGGEPMAWRADREPTG